MRAWRVSQVGAAAVVAGLVIAGCQPPPPVEPMPTDGPNQVVIAVPGMT
jgi:hypothetical protein